MPWCFPFFSAFRASSVCCLCDLISYSDLHSTYWKMCKNCKCMHGCGPHTHTHTHTCTHKTNGKSRFIVWMCGRAADRLKCVWCWMRYQDNGGYFLYANFCLLPHYLEIVTPPLSNRTFWYLNRTWMRWGGGAYSEKNKLVLPSLASYLCIFLHILNGRTKDARKRRKWGKQAGCVDLLKGITRCCVSVYTYLRRLVICKHA